LQINFFFNILFLKSEHGGLPARAALAIDKRLCLNVQNLYVLPDGAGLNALGQTIDDFSQQIALGLIWIVIAFL
jgi:hypothetical protein